MKLSLTQKFMSLTVPLILIGLVVSGVTWRTLNQGTEDLHKANELNSLAQFSRLYVSEMGSALKVIC